MSDIDTTMDGIEWEEKVSKGGQKYSVGIAKNQPSDTSPKRLPRRQCSTAAPSPSEEGASRNDVNCVGADARVNVDWSNFAPCWIQPDWDTYKWTCISEYELDNNSGPTSLVYDYILGIQNDCDRIYLFTDASGDAYSLVSLTTLLIPTYLRYNSKQPQIVNVSAKYIPGGGGT